jgi:hypothetical protein
VLALKPADYQLTERSMNKEEANVPIYTPVLKSNGVRLRIRNPIFEEGFRDERRLIKKGIIRDPETGNRYMIYGKACGLPNCHCDAWAVEI